MSDIHDCGYGRKISTTDGADFECLHPDADKLDCDNCEYNGTKRHFDEQDKRTKAYENL